MSIIQFVQMGVAYRVVSSLPEAHYSNHGSKLCDAREDVVVRGVELKAEHGDGKVRGGEGTKNR